MLNFNKGNFSQKPELPLSRHAFEAAIVVDEWKKEISKI